MPAIRRIGLDDVLPGLPLAIYGPDAAADARALDALRRVAVALDHVVNRAGEEDARFGRRSGPDSPENLADFDECERQVRVMELGAAAGRAMVAALRAQFPGPPEPAKPKPAKP